MTRVVVVVVVAVVNKEAEIFALAIVVEPRIEISANVADEDVETENPDVVDARFVDLLIVSTIENFEVDIFSDVMLNL